MKEKLPMMAVASGQAGNLPGARINSENELARLKTDVGDTIDHLKAIHSYLYTIVHSKQRIQQYELEAIANQLRVAGMPTATIFQELAGIFHQNYARDRRAAEKTVDISAAISRGYARQMGMDVSDISNDEIHGTNFGMITGDLEQTVHKLIMHTLGYVSALTQYRLQEAAGYAEAAKGVYRELHPFRLGESNE